MSRLRLVLHAAPLIAFVAGCAPDGLTAPDYVQRPLASFSSCSPRGDTQVPTYAAGSWLLPLAAHFPCNSTVLISDPTSNDTIAAAVGSIASAMSAPGIPSISTLHGSPDYTVKVGFTGGTGPWSGAVTYVNGIPDSINFDGSCSSSCGSLEDVALNELTQLYGMADGAGSKWDTFGEANISDHCAALGPAKKVWDGTICRFEIEAVYWKYGLIDSIAPHDKHIITDLGEFELSSTMLVPYGYILGDTLTMKVPVVTAEYVNPSIVGQSCGSECILPRSVVPYVWSPDDSQCYLGSFSVSDTLARHIIGSYLGDHVPCGEATPSAGGGGVYAGINYAVSVDGADFVTTQGLSPTANTGVIIGFVFSIQPPEIESFSLQSCSIQEYGGKDYAHQTLSWSIYGSTPYQWEMVESETNTPVGGTLVGTSTSGTSLALDPFLAQGGPEYRYYFVRYFFWGIYGDWEPLNANPLDRTACEPD